MLGRQKKKKKHTHLKLREWILFFQKTTSLRWASNEKGASHCSAAVSVIWQCVDVILQSLPVTDPVDIIFRTRYASCEARLDNTIMADNPLHPRSLDVVAVSQVPALLITRSLPVLLQIILELSTLLISGFSLIYLVENNVSSSTTSHLAIFI